jgi:DNA-binding response OmpR family regulator
MKKPKILIVEDEAIIAYDLKIKLEHRGLEVLPITATAKAAVKEAKKNNPNLILMDIILKGSQNGIDSALEIQASQNIPIIFLTGNRRLIDMVQIRELKKYNILDKPPSDFELMGEIKRLCKGDK